MSRDQGNGASSDEIPELQFLEELRLRVERASESGSSFRLNKDAFCVYVDNKTIDGLIYQDTQQVYKDLIAKAVDHAKNSYEARFEAARILQEHGVVINAETIHGVINGETTYIRAQAEYFAWSAIVACPSSLKVINGGAHITTIPVSRFVVLHLYNFDLSFEENEYMLNKKSRNEENEYGVIEFDGRTLVAGEVSAVSKK
ncbi:MAG: hypothetical protein LBO72_00145 [Helicobacteraceae bacterium]|jgi:hypothetical protein|nr:hypothetical protein [Helicobacteraceae bacterium]